MAFEDRWKAASTGLERVDISFGRSSLRSVFDSLKTGMPEPAGSAGSEIVVATTNAGKFAEMRALLEPYASTCRSIALWRTAPVAENATTYRQNAERKAISAARATGLMALSDDSGLEVDALGGRPGVATARWTASQGGEANARQALRTLQGDLDPCGTWGARAVSALCLALPDGRVLVSEGSLRGRLTWPPRTEDRGLLGMFIPEGHRMSLAETMEHELSGPLPEAEASHRALAFRDLLAIGAARVLWLRATRPAEVARSARNSGARE